MTTSSETRKSLNTFRKLAVLGDFNLSLHSCCAKTPTAVLVSDPQVAAWSGTNSQETKEARGNRAVLQPLAVGCETLPSSQVPPRGVEQRDQTSGKSETPAQGGTVCGTADAQNSPLDPQLQLLIQRWPTLSKAVQQQIMLLVG